MIYTCTDGFVTKEIEAPSPAHAADIFALVSCNVTVTDENGNEEKIRIIMDDSEPL